jgi:hypothetical protein
MALIGPSGSGKTYTGLRIAAGLGQKIAVVDTERGSASKYADKWSFDVCELTSFSPTEYVKAIHEAETAGYDVLVIDSLSHAWMGRDGALELVDKAAKRQQSGNSFGAWREVTPLHNQMIDAILGANLHAIVTMRTKMDYVQERDEKSGRTVIRKVGLQPVQRDGLEYEFDVIGDLDMDNNLVIGKSRCEALTGQVYAKAGENVAVTLRAWLTDGAPAQPQPDPPTPETAPPAAQGNGPTLHELAKQAQAKKMITAAWLATWCQDHHVEKVGDASDEDKQQLATQLANMIAANN